MLRELQENLFVEPEKVRTCPAALAVLRRIAGARVQLSAGRPQRSRLLPCRGTAESGLCLAGEVRRRTSLPGGVGGHLRAARKVRGRRTASNSCPHRLILCAAHTPWSSIRVHRYDYARRGARRRPRPDRAHPRCRRCRCRRPRRPRCRPSRDSCALPGEGVTDARQERAGGAWAGRRGSVAATAGPGPGRGCSMVAYMPVEAQGAHVRTRCMCFGRRSWSLKKVHVGRDCISRGRHFCALSSWLCDAHS